ncbi:MAG: tRNA (adenosine(37)-N6)-dimethylallyltransferase MiaA [Planctomycetota bacterium]
MVTDIPPDAPPLEVTVLTGPTACGKSAVGLCLAERLGAEILSVDSMKVYRRMDIGTAKPTLPERSRVPHHLIDLREPWEGYTVHEYVRDAEAAARDCASRGRAVLMEGGTPLYLKAFLEGLFEGPPPDEGLRARLRAEAAEQGLARLHARLERVDPKAAARIHINDERRVIRALEVHEQTGTPISELQRQFGTRRQHVRARVFALARPREELRRRIARRVDRMLGDGWLDEARALLEAHEGAHPLSRPALGALGYRELWAHLRGEMSLDEARRRIARETGRFVRKQMTWLRSFGDAVWLDASDDPAADAEHIASELAGGAGGG